MRIYYYGKMVSETNNEGHNNGSPVGHIKQVLEEQFGHINKKAEEKTEDKSDEKKPGFVVRHYQNA